MAQNRAGIGSFRTKMVAIGALVGTADLLFLYHEPGITLALFALLWSIAVTWAHQPHHSAPRIALALSFLFALTLAESPSPLGWLLFAAALSSAALLTRTRFHNAADWALRLLAALLSSTFRPLSDLLRCLRLRRRTGGTRWLAALRIGALPVLGGAMFLILFIVANPVFGDLFARIRLPDPGTAIGHMLFWLVVAHLVWPSLRPAPTVTGYAPIAFEVQAIRGVPAVSILLSLAIFNLIFLAQNIADIAFLWSGLPLPGTITLADYAHRGAYSLIATALLAGAFVLFFLDPANPAARRPLVRNLVILWVAQNLMLVGSSILRTWDYVQAYSLTEWRISALLWMTLVGVGLVLICWRLIAGRSSRWLINANALTLALVLSVSSIVDFGSIAAWWNVRHGRTVGNEGNAIDLCYLNQLGESALLPIIDLEQRAKGPVLRDKIAHIRAGMLHRLAAQQADWHSWTWRGARRLAAAQAALGAHPAAPKPAEYGRDCDGARQPKPVEYDAPPPPQPVPPLTKGTEQ